MKTHARTRTCTHINAHAHAHVHAHVHARVNSHAHAQTQAQAQAQAQVQAQAQHKSDQHNYVRFTRICIHMYIDTYTLTHVDSNKPCFPTLTTRDTHLFRT